MTSVIRKAAGGLSILEAIWVIYALYEAPLVGCSTPLCPGLSFNPLFPQIMIGLAAVLLVIGLIGIWGSWFAYPAGALFSAILLAAMGYSAWAEGGYTYIVGEYYQALIGALAAIALLVNLLAWRSRTVLSEQANPMNLPVFG